MIEDSSIRLDIAVKNKLDNVSRSTANKVIEDGLVKVNSRVVIKPSTKVNIKDKLQINYQQDAVKLPKISIPIIYEDNNAIVIDKPVGILTHSKGNFNNEASIASWLSPMFNKPTSNRSGIVHRLDRLTSGVMIVAKNDQTELWLKKQFQNRRVKKTYLAIIEGRLPNDQAIINLPIERHPKKPQSFRVGHAGKKALTEYRVIKRTPNYSLIELKPATGRTHQLRVHLAYLGHPIVGDPLYRGKDADRMYLHAHKLELSLPNKETGKFTSKLPKEFKIFMDHDKSTT